MKKELRTKVLEPRTAIAFSERQWRALLRLPTKCLDCLDPEYVATVRLGGLNLLFYSACEYFMCVPVINVPYARIFVYGTYDIPDPIVIDWEKEAVILALKQNLSFRRLFNKYRVAKLMWVYSSEFDVVRNKRYPIFHVILNNSKSSVEIPIC